MTKKTIELNMAEEVELAYMLARQTRYMESILQNTPVSQSQGFFYQDIKRRIDTIKDLSGKLL